MSLKTISTKLPSLQLPEKLKGTIVERWANYWKGLARDYKGKQLYSYNFNFKMIFVFILEVAVDSYKSIRSNPMKSTVYGSFGVFLYGCCKTNPSYREFTEQLKKSEQLIALVMPDSQNPKSAEYVKMLVRSQNNDTLRITSLGFFSIMWLDDNASVLSTYGAKCDYLQPEFESFHERIIDIGWLNNWWNLEKQLKDYDVNF